jgi:hypothetical protein
MCISHGFCEFGWFNKVTGMYIVQVSLLLIGQQSLGHFFKLRPLLPSGRDLGDCFICFMPMTNKAPTTLSAIQAASQSTFIKYTIKLHL